MLELCDKCEIRQAEIFQAEGNYCVDCWQSVTSPSSVVEREQYLPVIAVSKLQWVICKDKYLALRDVDWPEEILFLESLHSTDARNCITLSLTSSEKR